MTQDQLLPDRADVVIVGGGIIGASTAFFLSSNSEFDIVVIEKDAIGSGSTGDSSAVIRHHYGPNEMYTRMAQWSHQFYKSFEDETAEQISYEKNPFIRFGENNTQGGKYAQEGYQMLSKNDIPVSKLSREELDKQYPMLDIPDADFGISDDSAAYSDGTDVAGGFARAAQSNGANIHTDIRAKSILVKNEKIIGLQTNKGYIRCNNLVLSAGPWTPNLAESINIDIPITPEREQVLILDPPDEFAEQHPDLTPTTAPPGGTWYMRSDFGDHVLIATHHRGDQVDPNSYQKSPDEDVLLELLENIESVIPGLGDADIVGQYCGIYSTTPDHDFIIDEIMENCYAACGFSGHGFKHAPVIGKGLQDYIKDGSTDLFDLEYFSLDRFENNPNGHGLPADNV